MANPENKVYAFPIDLVYLWVDGNDPEWLARKLPFIDKSEDSAKVGKGRFTDNSELKYSLRSAEVNAPWIRKIFVVTDRQVPEWLEISNPKIQIVDHTDILPDDALPTFNSTVIEHALHKIPGLSEHFLYANDDMFFGKKASPSDFFLEDGIPILRLSRRPLRKFTLWIKEKVLGKKISNYNLTIQNSAKLVEQRYGKYVGHKIHHNIDAYRKSDYAHTFEVFRDEIEKTYRNHLRADSDIQRNLYSYVPMVEKKGKIKFVGGKESFRCHIDNARNFAKLEKRNPFLFCLNDSEYASDPDREKVKSFLERRFPVKSQFEK